MTGGAGAGEGAGILTFDCYGTLIDWEGGIADAFAAEAGREGVTLDRRAVLAAYATIEPIVESEAFRSYRDVLTETARRVATRVGWRLQANRASFLADSLPRWRPFPDTGPALERLSEAGWRLAILSNVDDDLLAATLRFFPVSFAFTVTAQQVRSYKPAHGHFRAARERIGSDRWIHAAQSYFHDVIPARSLGIVTAWVNRKGEVPPDAEGADITIRTMADLADVLGA